MQPIDTNSRLRELLNATSMPTPQTNSGRGGKFTRVLKTIAAAAAAAVPIAGPAIEAIAHATKRRPSIDLESIGGASEALSFLHLQREIELETRAFETASNVMKARHDAHMNSIRNMRS